MEEYSAEDVIDKFKKNGVDAFLSNSRTNEGTLRLAQERASSGVNTPQIVPFIRLYRNRDDYTSWFNDPEAKIIWAHTGISGVPLTRGLRYMGE